MLDFLYFIVLAALVWKVLGLLLRLDTLEQRLEVLENKGQPKTAKKATPAKKAAPKKKTTKAKTTA